MATYTIPSSSDEEWGDDDTTSTRSATKPSLFERRKEFDSSTVSSTTSHSSTAVHSSTTPHSSTTAQSSTTASTSSIASTASKDELQQAVVEDAKKSALSITTTQPAAVDAPQGQSMTTKSAPTSSSGANSVYRILVNKKQKGNPILKFVRNVPWEFDAIVPDYVLGQGTCALYISVKYHNRFPEYIHTRLKELGKGYNLRILLVQVDTKQQDISVELNKLSKICILADCTMILAFSLEEAGRYLEVYKAYENKPPTDIMARTKTDFHSQATEFLTAVKGVNKTDATTLLTRFKTIKGIINADVDTLSLCPGIGPVKARRLHSTFVTSIIRQKPGTKSSQTDAMLPPVDSTHPNSDEES